MIQTKGVSRRSFIAYSALNSSLTLFFPSSTFALCGTAKTVVHNKFYFSDQMGMGPEINAPVIERKLCSLHQEVMPPQPIRQQEKLPMKLQPLCLQPNFCVFNTAPKDCQLSTWSRKVWLHSTPFLPRIITYMKQHGLQRALNMYKHNPSEFMKNQKR